MGGLSNAFWLWLPVLIYKAVAAFFRTIWKLNLWILQTVSGVPLYYCKPEYRIPGIFVGTFGVISIFNFLFFLLVMSSASRNNVSHRGLPLNDFLTMGLVGLGLLLLCRLLIRRGSI
jgi:hypothetical protein